MFPNLSHRWIQRPAGISHFPLPSSFPVLKIVYLNQTRMHSSRMRTARLLPVSPKHALLGWGGGGSCLVRWGVPGRGVPGPKGYTYLVLGLGGLGGGYLPSPRGCKCLPRYSSLWTEFLTHASENITLPQASFGGR